MRMRVGLVFGIAVWCLACGDDAADGASASTGSSGGGTPATGSTGPGGTGGAGTGGSGAGGGGGPSLGAACAPIVAGAGAVFVRPAVELDAANGVAFDGDGSTWGAASADGAPGARKELPWSGDNQGLHRSALQRGATYYLAGGRYAGVGFDDEEDGETPITLVTATTVNAGATSGWDDALAGQVIFDDYLAFNRGHYVLDGQTRDTAAWDDSDAYGLRVEAVVAHWDNFPPGGHHVSIACASVGAEPGSGYAAGLGNGVWLSGGGEEAVHDWTISRTYVHETRTPIHMSGFRTATIEHSYLGPSWGKEAIMGIYTAYDVTVRHNVFVDVCQDVPDDPTAAGCTAEVAAFNSQGGGNYDGWRVYGNVFTARDVTTTAHTDAVVLGGGGVSVANGWRVYNNTITGLGEGTDLQRLVIDLSGTDNLAANNLWVSVGDGATIGCSAETCQASGCWDETSETCDGADLLGDDDPLVDGATGNMQLAPGAWARDAGVEVVGEDAIDMLGTARGADGTWDLGALEGAP